MLHGASEVRCAGTIRQVLARHAVDVRPPPPRARTQQLNGIDVGGPDGLPGVAEAKRDESIAAVYGRA